MDRIEREIKIAKRIYVGFSLLFTALILTAAALVPQNIYV